MKENKIFLQHTRDAVRAVAAKKNKSHNSRFQALREPEHISIGQTVLTDTFTPSGSDFNENLFHPSRMTAEGNSEKEK